MLPAHGRRCLSGLVAMRAAACRLASSGNPPSTHTKPTTVSTSTASKSSPAGEKKPPDPMIHNWSPVGYGMGHQDDPEYWTEDAPLPSQLETPDMAYREALETPRIDHRLVQLLSAFIFFWVTYNLYYKWTKWPGDFGYWEWYIPYVEEFTDEELGIPSDDSDDPEYWGSQQPLGYGD